MNPDYEYGPTARLDRDYESLTKKQKSVVDSIIQLKVEATQEEIAENAGGVSPTYVIYVRDNFPHIIDERRAIQNAATDGGEETYTFQFTSDETWKAMQLLNEPLSQKMWKQVRSQ